MFFYLCFVLCYNFDYLDDITPYKCVNNYIFLFIIHIIIMDIIIKYCIRYLGIYKFIFVCRYQWFEHDWNKRSYKYLDLYFTGIGVTMPWRKYLLPHKNTKILFGLTPKFFSDLFEEI